MKEEYYISRLPRHTVVGGITPTTSCSIKNTPSTTYTAAALHNSAITIQSLLHPHVQARHSNENI